MSLFNVREHQVPCQHIREYPRATAHHEEETLHLAVKQYTPIGNASPKPGDITIIGAPANGFPKELYEPLWDELLLRSTKNNFSIRSIWIADVAHQGQSGVLNEDKLGNDPSWDDHTRDLLLMINHFRDELPRPIFGIGHSMGGCNLINLSLIHPRLLSALVLLDPVVFLSFEAPSDVGGVNPVYSSTFRRDTWPSRALVDAYHRKSKFFSKWDPRVLELWLKHGFRDLPTPLYPDQKTGVTLLTTKNQEIHTFVRATFDEDDPKKDAAVLPDLGFSRDCLDVPFYRPEPIRTHLSLPFLRPPTLYVFGELSGMSTSEYRAQKVSMTGIGPGGSGGIAVGNVEEIVLKDVGHLVPMEAVDACAHESAAFLGRRMRLWRQEQEHMKTWKAKPMMEKRALHKEWLKRIPMLKDKCKL